MIVRGRCFQASAAAALTLALFSSPASAQVSSRDQVSTSSSLSAVKIFNFGMINANYYRGGQPKAEGVKAGVPDICLPVARRNFHGLYIEMKVGKNKQTPAQQEWDKQLSGEGYIVAVQRTWYDAAHTLMWYLGHDAKDFGL